VRVQLQPAFVLHSRQYRDSSLLLEVFTTQFGRITLVAKGARRAVRGRSRGAILQPFIPLLLSYSGRSELKTLIGSEVAGVAPALKGERLFSGIYLNELMVRLLHQHDAHPGLFVAYGDAVASLSSEEPLDDVLRRFEFNLLEQLGYGFDLLTEGNSGDPIDGRLWYCYHQDIGLVEQRKGESPSPGQPVFAGSDLLDIARGELSENARRAAKRLFRQALAGHLGGKPLKSRELFARPARRIETRGDVL
jgi:DNA repair protein RecO (recombination protein O)